MKRSGGRSYRDGNTPTAAASQLVLTSLDPTVVINAYLARELATSQHLLKPRRFFPSILFSTLHSALSYTGVFNLGHREPPPPPPTRSAPRLCEVQAFIYLFFAIVYHLSPVCQNPSLFACFTAAKRLSFLRGFWW